MSEVLYVIIASCDKITASNVACVEETSRALHEVHLSADTRGNARSISVEIADIRSEN